MARKIRVVILTCYQGIINVYCYRLSHASDIQVVGSALCEEELKRLLACQPADVLLLDFPIFPDYPNLHPILN